MNPVEIAERYRQVEPKLLPWQREHTKQLLRSLHRTRDALDASDTGTGKTFCALAAMHALNLPALVVCPYSLLPVWKECAAILGVNEPSVINYEMLRTGNTEYGQFNGKRFVWNITAKDSIIIFDECHRLKDYRTKQCATGLSAVEQGYYVMGLSATAADNPMHMKFIATLAKLIRPNDFFGWMLRHGVRRVQIGWRRKRQILQFTGGKQVLTYLHSQLFPLHGSRMRIADIPDFPTTQIVSEVYQMPEGSEIQRIYEEMRKEIAELKKRMAKDWKTNVLTVRLRARQQIELLKVPTMVRMAMDGAAEGMSVIIFVNYEATLQGLSERLDTFCIVHGEQTGEERTNWVSQFRQDEEPYLIANIKAGGVGLGYHGKRPRLVLLSPSDSAIDVRQALGRAPRAGGNWSIQKIVWAAGTVEEESCRSTRKKLSHIDTLNDGDLAPELTF